MPDQQNTPDNRPKRNLVRTKAVEQHDQEMASKRTRQETKAKKNNIKAQREAMNTRDDDPVSPDPVSPARVNDRAIVEIPTSRKKSSANAKNTYGEDSPERAEDTPAPKQRAPAKDPRARANKDTQIKPRAGSQTQTQTKTRNGSPNVKSKEVPARVKGKGGPDPTVRYKLIADIAKRDKRFDHTEFDLKTLQMIWDSGKETKRDEPSAPKANRYKEISLLGTMDIDDSSSHTAARSKDKTGGFKTAPAIDMSRARRISSVSSASSVRSMTPVQMSRQSTPAASFQVLSKAFRPTPVASGPRAMSGYSTSRSASPFDRSGDFASDFDESFVEEIEAVTVSCPKKANPKPKRSDYEGTVLELLDATYEEVAARLVTTGFFPGRKDFDDIVTQSWKHCAKKLGVNPNTPRYKLDDSQRKVTKYRISSFQGRIKDAVMAHIEEGLNLKGTQTSIRTEAVKLLPHGFHKKPGSEDGKGQYQHPFVQTALNYAFFDMKTKSTPIGVTHSSHFNGRDGMPLPTVALTCAVIHWCVDQFKTGSKNLESQMQTAVIQKYYDVHLDNLNQFQKINTDLADVMRKKWYISAVKHTKAPAPKANKIDPIEDLSPCLILPDKPTKNEREAVSGALQRLESKSRAREVKDDPNDSSDADEPSDGPDNLSSDAKGDDRRKPRKSGTIRPIPRRAKGWGEESMEEEAEDEEEQEEEEEEAEKEEEEAEEEEEEEEAEEEEEEEAREEEEEEEAEEDAGGEHKGMEDVDEGGNGGDTEEAVGYDSRVTRSSPARLNEAAVARGTQSSPTKFISANGKSAARGAFAPSGSSPAKARKTGVKGGPVRATRTSDEEMAVAPPVQRSPSKGQKRRYTGMDGQPGSEEEEEVMKPVRKKGKGGQK